MKDKFGRKIEYMRISITDRCNLRCKYCMPNGFQDISHNEILTYEEILKICSYAVKLGITKFKITGGEPLMRKDCVDFIKNLKKMQKVEQVTLTTNGILLENYLYDLKSLGIDGINISLDSCDKEQYLKITGFDGVDIVLSAIKKSVEIGIKTKINCVPLKGYNDDNIPMLIELARELELDVRFIEIMPIGNVKYFASINVSQIKENIYKKYQNVLQVTENRGNGPASYLRIADFKGCIGFIDSIHNKFCASCNRVRLSSNGFLKACLYYDTDINLKELLRSNKESLILDVFRDALLNKNKEHHFGESLPERDCNLMTQIGG